MGRHARPTLPPKFGDLWPTPRLSIWKFLVGARFRRVLAEGSRGCRPTPVSLREKGKGPTKDYFANTIALLCCFMCLFTVIMLFFLELLLLPSFCLYVDFNTIVAQPCEALCLHSPLPPAAIAKHKVQVLLIKASKGCTELMAFEVRRQTPNHCLPSYLKPVFSLLLIFRSFGNCAGRLSVPRPAEIDKCQAE